MLLFFDRFFLNINLKYEFLKNKKNVQIEKAELEFENSIIKISFLDYDQQHHFYKKIIVKYLPIISPNFQQFYLKDVDEVYIFFKHKIKSDGILKHQFVDENGNFKQELKNE